MGKGLWRLTYYFLDEFMFVFCITTVITCKQKCSTPCMVVGHPARWGAKWQWYSLSQITKVAHGGLVIYIWHRHDIFQHIFISVIQNPCGKWYTWSMVLTVNVDKVQSVPLSTRRLVKPSQDLRIPLTHTWCWLTTCMCEFLYFSGMLIAWKRLVWEWANILHDVWWNFQARDSSTGLQEWTSTSSLAAYGASIRSDSVQVLW